MYMIENEMYMIEQLRRINDTMYYITQEAKSASLQLMSQWQIVGLHIN